MSPWAEETQGKHSFNIDVFRIAFRELEMELGIVLQLLGEIPSGTLGSVSPGSQLWGI